VPTPFGISADRHDKPEAILAEERPARALVPLLRSWNWLRPAVDPWLMRDTADMRADIARYSTMPKEAFVRLDDFLAYRN